MNDFETQMTKLAEEANSLQGRERQLNHDNKLFSEKLMGFLKENGLPDSFTLPQMALLAIRKSRELIKL